MISFFVIAENPFWPIAFLELQPFCYTRNLLTQLSYGIVENDARKKAKSDRSRKLFCTPVRPNEKEITEMAGEVGKFVAQIDPKRRRCAREIRRLVKQVLPQAKEGIKMGIPVYTIGKEMIVAFADYKDHLNLYFMRGAELDSRLLEGTGKDMRHIRIEGPPDINRTEFSRLLRLASKLTPKKTSH